MLRFGNATAVFIIKKIFSKPRRALRSRNVCIKESYNQSVVLWLRCHSPQSQRIMWLCSYTFDSFT